MNRTDFCGILINRLGVADFLHKPMAANAPARFYFNEEYQRELEDDLRCTGNYEAFTGNELKPTSKNCQAPKMCSVVSSSRLCYLYFSDKNKFMERVEFEKKMPILKDPRATPPHLDACIENALSVTYYECKCCEIFDRHSLDMSVSYEKKLRSLGVKNVGNNNIKNRSFKLTAEDFGLTEKIVHFDFGQLFRHLLGIVNATNKIDKTHILQYLFFIPCEAYKLSKECPSYIGVLNKLEDEINDIWSSEIIERLRKSGLNEVMLPPPRFVPVTDIHDRVLTTLVTSR
jgi:hypothetical protein